ncbi:Uncharacterised protein [Legionella hackeliae]|uniref:Uncharacterized protein n=1 Tax=Legionella hackeliae TaxID=449 RepID=A0A0A8UMH5_LEGHA|nr:protein of unknown function [Legionella hackeliae]STX49866.1 Uncharacterised protein [Legionella hackeliae]
MGAEIFNQTGNLVTGKQTTLTTLGGSYNFKSNLSFLFSLGHQIAGERHLMSYLVYIMKFKNLWNIATLNKLVNYYI